MKNLQTKVSMGITTLYGKKGRLAILALTIALFVLSAGAPNASISIGK
jgi:hypothetical protein